MGLVGITRPLLQLADAPRPQFVLIGVVVMLKGRDREASGGRGDDDGPVRCRVRRRLMVLGRV